MAAGTIALILNFSFVFILVIGFLIGMWRGIKKASINLIFSIMGVFVAFFCCGLVTNAILDAGITVNGQPDTINGFFVSLLKANPDIAHLIETTPSFETFIVRIPYVFMNVIVFLFLTLAVEFVTYILYKIFGAIFVKNKDKDGNKLPKHRLTGGIIGLVKTFILCFFVLMPFISLIGTASEFTSGMVTSAAMDETEEGDASNKEMTAAGVVANSIEGINTSAFGVIGNMFGLDDAMFDYLTKFDLNGETVQVRKEIANYLDVYNAGMEIKLVFEGKSNQNFSQLDFDRLDKTLDALLNSSLYNTVVSDVLNNLLIHYDEYSFIDVQALGDFGQVIIDISGGLSTFEGGAKEYFAQDLRSVYEVYKNLAKGGTLDTALKGKSVAEVLYNLSNENYVLFKQSLKNILTTNIMKDSVDTVINIGLSSVLEDADSVEIEGRTLDEQEWEGLSQSLANVVKHYSFVAKETDVVKLLNNPLTLLSSESNVDIVKVFNSLGSMIDEARGITLLKNTDGDLILDKVLTKFGFELPSNPVFDKEGKSVEIKNYNALMNFISPSLVELKGINVYNQLTDDTISISDVITTFAVASQQKENVLSDIILPLYQVEPTKTLLIDNLINTLDNNLLNFKMLNSYQEWKNDLGYISTLLVTLNNGQVEGKTYLDMALENNTQKLLLNLGDDISITEIMKPLLYAKSTDGLKQSIFATFENVFNALLDSTSSIKFNYSQVTLVEGDANDQTLEICEIFEKFVDFYPSYDVETTLESMDKVMLGSFLDAMRKNAYRKDLDVNKTEEGLFKLGFDSLLSKIQDKYEVLKNIDDIANFNFTEFFTELAGTEQGEYNGV